MTDFTVPASELTVPSSNLSYVPIPSSDDTLTNYLSSLSPSDQAAVNAAALFAQQNANAVSSANIAPTGNTPDNTPSNLVDSPWATVGLNGGVIDMRQYLSNPDYQAQINTYINTLLQSGLLANDPDAARAVGVIRDIANYQTLYNENAPGYQNLFSPQPTNLVNNPGGSTTSTAAPTPTGLESLVPPGGDQTQPQIQTQPAETAVQPQGEQVVMGGGETSGRSCPAPWIKITMADGGVVKAGDIKPGMMVYTRHETTGEWGNFPVTAVEQGEDTRWAVLFEGGAEFVGTYNHRVMTDKEWTEIQHLRAGDKVVQHEGFAVVKTVKYLDHGPVVKIEVQDAHTYLSEGVLSHNIKINEGIGIAGGSGVNDELQEIVAARGGLMALARGGMTHPFFSKATGKYNFHPAQMYADGGMPVAMAMGGLGTLGGYSDGGRLLKGPGDGVSDSIPASIGQNAQPARLADGEFVIPARIVSELGNGSTDAGARKLYAMMDRVQRTRSKTTGKDNVAVNSRADRNLPV
jgi:hypothetical protein